MLMHNPTVGTFAGFIVEPIDVLTMVLLTRIGDILLTRIGDILLTRMEAMVEAMEVMEATVEDTEDTEDTE
jgi:hypothetical protein